MGNQHEYLMEVYFQEKEIPKRNEILRNLLLDMPDCFKNIFTLDELGNLRTIRSREDVEKSWQQFFGR